jgi:hypothetical protein
MPVYKLSKEESELIELRRKGKPTIRILESNKDLTGTLETPTLTIIANDPNQKNPQPTYTKPTLHRIEERDIPMSRTQSPYSRLYADIMELIVDAPKGISEVMNIPTLKQNVIIAAIHKKMKRQGLTNIRLKYRKGRLFLVVT